MTTPSPKRPPAARNQPGQRGRPRNTTSARRRGQLVWALVAIVAVGGLVLWRLSSESAAPVGAAFVGGDFHSLVVDPTQPDTIYVGGHEAVSRSTDAGATWERVDSLDGADAMGWGFTGDAMFVSGHPGLTLADAGITSFARHNTGLPDTDLHALGAGGGTVYAAGPGAGVIASTDNGATWQTRTTDAGQPFFGRILVDNDATTLTASDTQRGPVRSTDGGRTWTPLGGPPSLWLTRSGESIIASGGQGAYRSADDGATWQPFTIPDGAQLVEADPHTPGRLFAGGHSGTTVDIWVSTDDGRTWEAV
ncbi:MAG: WD40/YVTN/BNR-like repeat-containing protein [Microthrixaceae bacterium]